MKTRVIYILTVVDLVRVGYNVDNVYVFDKIEDATSLMKEEYLNKCKEEGIENPMEDCYDYQYSENGFAYIQGKYYWDIFTRKLY